MKRMGTCPQQIIGIIAGNRLGTYRGRHRQTQVGTRKRTQGVTDEETLEAYQELKRAISRMEERMRT